MNVVDDDEKDDGLRGQLRYGLLVWAYWRWGNTLDVRAGHGCVRILSDEVWKISFNGTKQVGGRYWNTSVD